MQPLVSTFPQLSYGLSARGKGKGEGSESPVADGGRVKKVLSESASDGAFQVTLVNKLFCSMLCGCTRFAVGSCAEETFRLSFGPFGIRDRFGNLLGCASNCKLKIYKRCNIPSNSPKF
eukprot:1176674-Prorocentrum_minimum.AAC.3